MRTELGSLTSIKTGKLDANASSENGIYPFFTCAVEPLKIDSYSYDCECVLVAGNGDLNVKYYNGKFDAYQRTYIIESKDKSKLTVPYLYYFLESYIETLRNQSIGGIIKYIKLGNLTNAPIPVLSIKEQNEIVKTLDKAKSIITHIRTQLEKLDLLVKARFVEMFGDVKLNSKGFDTIQLCKIANVSSSKRVFVEELQSYGIPFYRGTEVGALAEGKNIIPELFITEEHYNSLKSATGVPEIGDLLMPSICSDGRIWLVDTKEKFYFKDGRVLWIHPISNGINSIYLLYFLKQKIAVDYNSIASGTTFAELKIFSLKNLNLFMPSIKVQTQFADFVKKVDKSKVAMQKELGKAQTLFDSLMQEYFG